MVSAATRHLNRPLRLLDNVEADLVVAHTKSVQLLAKLLVAGARETYLEHLANSSSLRVETVCHDLQAPLACGTLRCESMLQAR
jgi:hypothetical protein